MKWRTVRGGEWGGREWSRVAWSGVEEWSREYLHPRNSTTAALRARAAAAAVPPCHLPLYLRQVRYGTLSPCLPELN